LEEFHPIDVSKNINNVDNSEYNKIDISEKEYLMKNIN
jgi:hypothetical protein